MEVITWLTFIDVREVEYMLALKEAARCFHLPPSFSSLENGS
jgi:hypothetical protein